MNAAADQSDSDLRSTLRRAHDQADELLADPEGSRLEVVTWLSGHVAAFEHAVYPVVKRKVAYGSSLVNEDRAVASRLARTLRMLERRHSGDVLATGLSAPRLGDRVSELVAAHRALQDRIVAALEAALDQDEMRKLVSSYEDALAHAPTRPHPHLHAGLMFRLDALWDRVLDTMDGRHVPLPRAQRSRITPGRWGAYLLGQQHEEQRRPRESA
ncbi:MAG TPA: hypothetical protein VG650_03265 [Mycobacteriales bacterium]|nr:hypothetical protein [Mycobacteriales bacterium]